MLNVTLGNNNSFQFVLAYEIIFYAIIENLSMGWRLKFRLICSLVPIPMMTVNGFTMRNLFDM